MIRPLLVALLVLAFSAGAAQARADDHGGGGGGGEEARVAATCGHGVAASLRLRSRDGRIELRFRLRRSRGQGVWRVAIVHEHRVSARAAKRTSRREDSFELRRTLPDLPGNDTVVVHAWGPRGLGCRAAATLAG